MGARGTEPGEQRIRSAALQPLGPSGAQQAASPRIRPALVPNLLPSLPSANRLAAQINS